MRVWEERAARNEALFRQVNERIEELHEESSDDPSAQFVCECADETCIARIEVPLSVYERVRSGSYLFIIAPDHLRAEIEHIEDKRSGFWVVRKDTPTTTRIAKQTDPRR